MKIVTNTLLVYALTALEITCIRDMVHCSAIMEDLDRRKYLQHLKQKVSVSMIFSVFLGSNFLTSPF